MDLAVRPGEHIGHRHPRLGRVDQIPTLPEAVGEPDPLGVAHLDTTPMPVRVELDEVGDPSRGRHGVHTVAGAMGDELDLWHPTRMSRPQSRRSHHGPIRVAPGHAGSAHVTLMDKHHERTRIPPSSV